MFREFDYRWRQCPECKQVWKTAPPMFCIVCGVATEVAEMPAIPWDSLLHGTRNGFDNGCPCAECHSGAMQDQVRRNRNSLARKHRVRATTRKNAQEVEADRWATLHDHQNS